jgi:anti-anti-sigma regulatory factor
VRIPAANLAELLALLPGALGLAILTFADTTATGRSFATRAGERTDANRELVALAVADAAGSLTGGYAVSSSPSRTAASEAAGSSSGLAGIVAAAAVLVVLLLLTGPLSYLPTPALGAVILASVLGIIDVPALLAILRVKKSEAAIALVAMGGVILYGTLVGVVIAVLLAALNIVRRAAAPPIVEEVRLPNGSWRDIARRGDGARVAGVLTVRFAGPLFFANATALRTKVRELVTARDDVEAVVLDFGATATVDLTAADAIREMADELARDGRRLVVARPMGHVRDELRVFGLEALMEATHGTYGSVDAAIAGIGLDPERPAVQANAAGTEPVTEPETGAAAGPVGPGPGPGGPGRRGDVFVLRILTALVGVVVGAAVLGVVIGALTGGASGGPRSVPNLVGMPLTRAEVAATDAGFDLIAPIYVRRDDRPEGTVVGQDPPPGTVADAGSEIQPIVSTGRQLVRVPDVTGQPEATAILALTSAGLQVRRTAVAYDPAHPAGVVVATDPPAGTSVASGTFVAYTVSGGPAPTIAPSPSAAPSPPGAPTATPPPTVPPTPTPGSPASPDAPSPVAPSGSAAALPSDAPSADPAASATIGPGAASQDPTSPAP